MDIILTLFFVRIKTLKNRQQDEDKEAHTKKDQCSSRPELTRETKEESGIRIIIVAVIQYT